MKKMLTLLSISIVSIMSGTNLMTSCLVSEVESSESKHRANASLLKWDLSPTDKALVKKYEKEVHKHASAKSIKEFNDLYDNNKTQATWSTYQKLEYDLTNTKVGDNKIDVNWTKMYKNAGLNINQIHLAQEKQLRFYNIFAKVFKKRNVLNLIQKVAPVSVKDDVVAWTAYDPRINSQRMGFGPDFVNTNLIREEYEEGFWSSNEIISVSTHEYGHALSNFMGLNEDDRAKINTNWHWTDELVNSNLNVNSEPSYYQTITNKARIIKNRAQYLMDYLGKNAHISDLNKKLLFSLVVVDSNYGRSAWDGQYNPQLEDEFFAESFAGWLLTPEKQRDWGWELKNNFFLHYLPEAL